jgi:hypothetical protein
MRQVIFILSLLCCTASHAEIYQGIKPESTLGDIKKIFPNANFQKVKAVWVTEADGFYSMTGQGLIGTIYLAFHDGRTHFRARAADLELQASELAQGPQTDTTTDKTQSLRSVSKLFTNWATKSEDDALTIKWVRWAPATPIPLTRYITKYGSPSKSGFTEDDMRPYNSWPTKGVLLYLSDDAKNVVVAEFAFTASEEKTECLARYKDASMCK